MSLLNTKDLSNLTGAKQLVDTLVASGITTSNITFKGVNGAVGTFTGGIGAGIGIESGIVLSTGQISFAANTNTIDSAGQNNEKLGDTDLSKIVGSLGTYDAAVLEFDFIPTSSEVSFSYVFASEEYPEWVGTRFNDVFAFYLNGQNIALVPGTTTPVAINTINGGNSRTATPATNSSFFVPNYFGNATKDIQFDGFTTVLSATATGLVPGVASRIKLAIADTADGELDSAVFVQASSFGNATLVTVVATDDYAKEGTTPDQGVFTITRTGSTVAPLTVSYSLSGSASSADYNPILSTVTIPAGSASTTVTVTPVDDTLTEGNETVILSLIDTNSYDLGRQNSGTVIIRDNESENIVVSLSVAPASVVEDGTGNLVYTFTRASGTTTPIDLTSPLTVNYNVGGSATLDSDYTQTGAASFSSTTGKITFAAGSATATLTIDPTVDTTIESNETVALTLASGSGYSVDTATAVIGTIVDDDTPVISLSLNPTSVTEDGTSNLVYTFTRTGSTISGLTVNYGVSGTATLGTDYVATGAASFTATTGTITFAAGSSTATLTIDPTPDTTVESDETVALTIAPATGYTVGTNTAVTGTILNDDTIVTTVTLAVNTTSVAENGTTNPVYTFTRTGVTTNALTVNYSVAGTADSTDYTGTTPGTGKTITFAAGATTATVTIDPTADTTVENNETVALTLASGTGYTVGTTTAVTTTIVNDDTRVTLALAPTSVAEDGTTNPVYTFTRTGVTTNALTVNYSV
ncbi:choice-of-anchor L domain-containing protein, partial [Dolichospermum sp. ST_sed6]|nr:choice-of-anchor L domain-containing protein [Dolichospermum sp. ST_sed6]